MANREGTTRELTEAYIGTAHVLINEIERAMAAITCNELGDLEESVVEQHALTLRLKMLREQYCVVNSVRAATSELAFEGDLSRELLVANVKLRAVNNLYQAVLQHSSHSASLMTSLLNSFTGQFQEASGSRLKHQTWSCQM